MKTASIKAILRLDNSHFIRGIRNAFAAAKLLGSHFAKRPFHTTGILGLQALRSSIKATAAGVGMLGHATVAFGGIAKTAFLTGSIAGIAFGAIMTKVVHDSIEAASTLESLTTTFSVLLKSADAGKQRMSDLLSFANDKGLRLTVVAEASKNLQTLTQGALATGKGLGFVGDVASGARRKFEDMAVTLGRVYDAMRAGTAAGDELKSLQDAGALSGGARRYIEGLSKIGKGAEAWKELRKELGKFTGLLDQQSKTWERKMEKFKDSIEEAQRQFGTPLIDAIKPGLTLLTNLMFQNADHFAEAGREFSATVGISAAILAATFSDPSSIAEPLKRALEAAIASSANYALAAFRSVFGILFNSNFYDGIAKSTTGMSLILGAQLTETFKSAIAYFITGMLDGWHLIKSVMDAKDPSNPFVDAAYLVQKKSIETARQDAEARKPGSGATSKMGEIFGRKGDIEMTPAEYKEKMDLVKSMSDDLERADKERQKALKVQRDVTHKRNAELAGDISIAAKESAEEGKKLLREGASSFFKTIKSAAKGFKVEDVFGANQKWEAAKDAIKPIIEKGNKIIKNAGMSDIMRRRLGQIADGTLKPSRSSSKVKAKSTLKSPTMVNGDIGMLPTSNPGPFAAHIAAYNQSKARAAFSTKSTDLSGARGARETPWLKKRERVQLDNLKVAGIMAVNGGINPRENNKIRGGDRKRMQTAIREKLREKEGVDRSNQILAAIQVRFDQLVAQ